MPANCARQRVVCGCCRTRRCLFVELVLCCLVGVFVSSLCWLSRSFCVLLLGRVATCPAFLDWLQGAMCTAQQQCSAVVTGMTGRKAGTDEAICQEPVPTARPSALSAYCTNPTQSLIQHTKPLINKHTALDAQNLGRPTTGQKARGAAAFIAAACRRLTLPSVAEVHMLPLLWTLSASSGCRDRLQCCALHTPSLKRRLSL